MEEYFSSLARLTDVPLACDADYPGSSVETREGAGLPMDTMVVEAVTVVARTDLFGEQ